VWDYEVSGKKVLRQWFSYRKKNRDRPIMGDRRPPSKLSDVQPDHWLAEYTSDLIDLLNILEMLADMEPAQTTLLERICDGPLIPREELVDLQKNGQSRKGARSMPSANGQQPAIDGLD
jgi:hypothetical protein